MNILVVEDTEDSRVLIVDQLQAKGYKVAFACDGVEAFEKLETFPADVIVSDILMPNMDGYELCKRIKTDSRFHEIPLIFYTATYTDPRDQDFALSLGASGFLVKPATDEELIQLIESVLADLKQSALVIPTKPDLDIAEYDHIKTDVLTRKLDKRNEQLHEQKEEFRIIADNLPVLIAEIDNQHYYSFANRTHEEWCACSGQNIVGRHMSDIVGDLVYKTIKKHLNYAGEDNNREYLLPFPDGKERYVTFNIKPQVDKHGKLSKFICLISDVSRMKKSEIELSLYKDHLEELVEERTAQLSLINRELEAFGYTVSHDLRNPIKSIEGFCHALEEELGERITPVAANYLVRIHGLTTRMDNLIKDLMSLSQISRKNIEYEEVELSNIAKEIIGELEQDDNTQKIQIHIGSNLKIPADSGLMRVVLENLIGNAWKFTKNVESPSIVFDAYERENDTVFYVKDNGAGFNAKFKDKIFTPFQRLHDPDEYPGTGIGLATVKRIIHRHGGSVWASSNEGQGASFYFSLPNNAPVTAASSESATLV